MSKVIDKYRPVDPTPTTRTRPWPIVGVSAGLVVLGALWSSADLVALVSSKESLPLHGAWMTAAQTLHGISTTTGIAAVRTAVDGVVDPLQHTAPVGVRPRPELPPQPVATVVTDTDPPDPQAPPGADWIGPADPGGDRVQRMLLIGASSMQYYLGTELERRLESEYPGMSVHRLGKLGTGLVRPDVFDWPATVRRLLQEHRPQVVVIQLGGNDAQPITADGKRISYGREGWTPEYQRRMGEMLRDIVQADAVPIVLGMPVMRDPGFSDRMRRMNDITREVARTEGARFVETWDLVSTDAGDYRVDVSFDGKRGRMRLQDGIHYSRLGARYLADRLIVRLEQEVPMVSAAPEEGVVPAVALRRVTPAGDRYVAYVPREVPEAGLPAEIRQKPPDVAWPAWADGQHADLPLESATAGRIVVLVDGDDGLAAEDPWVKIKAHAERVLPIAGWQPGHVELPDPTAATPPR